MPPTGDLWEFDVAMMAGAGMPGYPTDRLERPPKLAASFIVIRHSALARINVCCCP